MNTQDRANYHVCVLFIPTSLYLRREEKPFSLSWNRTQDSSSEKVTKATLLTQPLRFEPMPTENEFSSGSLITTTTGRE